MAVALLETPVRAEQAGVQEVEETPEFAEIVLNRRAGGDDADAALEALGGARALGEAVLDGLGLVEDNGVPGAAGQQLLLGGQ